MKRDARLRRCGERRAPRRLHGHRDRRSRLTRNTLRLYRALGLQPRYIELADGLVRLADSSRRARQAWIEHVLAPHARLVAEQMRDDLTFHGAAYVHVGFDLDTEVVTLDRIPPETIQPSWPETPLTQAQADQLDELELGPS